MHASTMNGDQRAMLVDALCVSHKAASLAKLTDPELYLLWLRECEYIDADGNYTPAFYATTRKVV